MTMKESLRQRWNASTKCLANELYSQLAQSDDTKSSSSSQSQLDSAASLLSNAISNISNQWLDRVESLYNEPHRAYHNMTHVEDVLASIDFLSWTPTGEPPSSSTCYMNPVAEKDAAILDLATFFHDVIYNPKSATNEKDSADLFMEFVSDLCSNFLQEHQQSSKTKITTTTQESMMQQSKMVSQIEQCIVATATHIASANDAQKSNNTLIATFLDADMSILGRVAAKYDNYAGCIRKEYEFVERNMYCEKRAEILESFLPLEGSGGGIEIDGDEKSTVESSSSSSSSSDATTTGKKKEHLFLYATKKGREVWEDQARQNLKREISMLRQGKIPCEE